MSELNKKTYWQLSRQAVVQDAAEINIAPCRSLEIAKTVAALWIIDECAMPYLLEWESYNNYDGELVWKAWIPHESKHPMRSMGFYVKQVTAIVPIETMPILPSSLGKGWVDREHEYDYGNIIIECPTCKNNDSAIETSKHMNSTDHFTHIVSQSNIKCSQCGARWHLYRDGRKGVDNG